MAGEKNLIPDYCGVLTIGLGGPVGTRVELVLMEGSHDASLPSVTKDEIRPWATLPFSVKGNLCSSIVVQHVLQITSMPQHV